MNCIELILVTGMIVLVTTASIPKRNELSTERIDKDCQWVVDRCELEMHVKVKVKFYYSILSHILKKTAKK